MTQSWPRALRHSLTQRIENSTLASMEALVNIRYRSEGRAQAIVELNRALKGQRFLWRLALRRGCIAHAQLGQVMTELDATGRMAQAWRKRILGGSDAP